MLTLDQLKDMTPDYIFASGHDPKHGYWVAVRGGIHDWAIYATPDENSVRHIADYGNKVWSEYAAELVDADADAQRWYRD